MWPTAPTRHLENGKNKCTASATIRQREADLQLARTNVERSRSLYERQLLPKQTLDDNEARYQSAVAALDARGPGAGAGIEIERKYLLTGMPPAMPGVTVSTLTQGYVPGERLVERLRVTEQNGQHRYFRTVKVGTGLVRTELEEETTRAVFEAMWPLTKGHRLTKRRHVVPADAADADGAGTLKWEIDEFTDRPLVLAEIELPDEAVEVVLPAWLAPVVDREVTGDPAYANFNLAR